VATDFQCCDAGNPFGHYGAGTYIIISEIVGEKQVMNAVFPDYDGQNILRLIGPAVAGFLIEAFDFSAVYYLNTGVYL